MSSTPPVTSARILSGLSQAPDLDLLSFSQALKACGDPLRVQILQVLKFDTFGVMELTQLFETKQSGMSHHLKVLSLSGLVEAQREGNAVFYRRPFNQSESFDKEAISNLFHLIDRFELDQQCYSKIQLIQQQRSLQSQAFFAKNADRFQEQQELIANHDQYADASLELLLQENLPKSSTILELGPGEGLFLKQLSQNFENIIALDNSEYMLNKARTYTAKERLSNIEFHLGDTQSYIPHKHPVDAVLMNMVLHHVPRPSQIFKDVYEFLNPGGTLIVCDLSHHNQEWVKDNCGDLWLGFDTEELTNWAQIACFKESKSLYIGLRNGFQIQLRKFFKPK